MGSEHPATETSSATHEQLRRALSTIRARARGLLLVGAVCVVVAAAIATVVVAGAADFVLRTPTWLRSALWVAGLVALGLTIRRRVTPAARFAPSLTEVALRVERSEPGQRAGLEGVLASGLELGGSAEAARAAGLVREAGTRFGGIGMAAVLVPARAYRAAGMAVGAVALVAAVWAMTPTLASIGVKRIVTPWSGAEWPKRTEVVDATSTSPHARGSGFLLRALLAKNRTLFSSDDSHDEARVVGRFRLIVDGEAAPARKVLLTKQNNVDTKGEPNGDADEGALARGNGTEALYEYLIEPWGLAPTGGTSTSGNTTTSSAETKVELEYWFETDDDATTPSRVLLVEPPAVIGAKLSLTPPAYYAGEDTVLAAKTTDLGSGSDERAASKPVLRGSRVELELALNKTLPAPNAADSSEWLSRTLGDDVAALTKDESASDGEAAMTWSLKENTLRVAWTMDKPMRMNVHLEDEHGIENVEAYSYFIDALEDKGPQASVTLPSEDKTVLATATVDVRGEGRDDVGLRSVSLWHQVARPPTDSSGVPAEPVGEPAELVKQEATKNAPATHGANTGHSSSSGTGNFAVASAWPAKLEVESRVELSRLNVKAGDEVWVTTRAIDGYELNGTTHEAAVSPIRRLRIISEEAFLEQVWAELGGVRRSAIALAEEEARLRSDTAKNAEASRLERSQAAISDRIAREQQAVNDVQQRLSENGLRDETMQEILRDAKQSLERAGESSVQASGELNQAKQNESKSGAPDAESRQKAEREQREAQRHLEDLAERLDQGEDTWSMKRSVEKLLEEQKSLKQKTSEIGRETTGKQSKDLTPAQREALERAAQEQQGLAQRATEAIQKMMDAEQKVRKNDPAAADAMNQATRQAQRDQLEQKMQQASEQVQQNQTNTAQSKQQEAIESMEQMLDQLKNTAKNRDEVLRRQLASLIESLQALIRDQEAQLDALMEGLVKSEVKGLDRGMARLHQNTLGVLDEAQKASREIAPVAELIDAAAAAQQQAVVALRVEPINADEAQDQEVVSLDKLKEAKELAEKLDRDAQNRQTERQRAQLKKAYTEALTQQLELRQSTDALVGVEANRRTRAEARTLGERQQALQDTMAKLASETKELSDAVVFSYAHKRLDDSMGKAASLLNEGTADRTVTRRQDSAVRVLQSLIAALDDSPKNEDEFRQQQEQQQQNGNQNQSGKMPLVPDAAQIKVLRTMQEEALGLTREAGESGDATLLEEVGQLQSDLATQAAELIRKMMEKQRPEGDGVESNIKKEGEGEKPSAKEEPPPAGYGWSGAPHNEPSPSMSVLIGFAQPEPKKESAPKSDKPTADPPKKPAEPATNGATPPSPAPPPPEKKPGPKEPPLPSLDDLLGTGDKTKPGDAVRSGDPLDPNSADLDRLLSGSEIGDAFKQAAALMGDVSKRLTESKDASLTTQRVQETIVRRLDQLLSSLEQMQQQQQSSSSQQPQPQPQQQQNVPRQQQDNQQNQENQGENQGQVIEPPGRRDGALRPGLEAARSAWGRLPDRVRDLLVQGSSDRFSSMYEAMTEAYYKKLAEQGKAR